MLQNSSLKIIVNQAAKFGGFFEVHKNPNIEQIYEKLFGLNKQLFSNWSEKILFKEQWWITLGLLIIPI